MASSGITVSLEVTVRDGSGVVKNKLLATDTTTWGIGIDYINIKAISPAGNVFFAHASGTGIAANGNVTIDLPTDTDGNIIKGVYTFVYTVKETLVSTEFVDTVTVDYQYVTPTPTINVAVNGFASTFISTDATNYAGAIVTRTHAVTPPSGSGMSGLSGTELTQSYAPNIFSGVYTTSLVCVLNNTTLSGYSVNDYISLTNDTTVYPISESSTFASLNAYVDGYNAALESNPSVANFMASTMILLSGLVNRYLKFIRDDSLLDAYNTLIVINSILNVNSDPVSVVGIIPFVNSYTEGTGEVKVDSSDTLGFLESKLDGITLQKDSGTKKVKVVDSPSLGGNAADTYAPIDSPDFTGSPTAPNLSIGDTSGKLANAKLVNDTKNALVDGAPLDTLAQLSAAVMNSDTFGEDFYVELGQKLASASYTAADVLAKLLTVDGAGSGLDSDLLDGQQGSYYYNPTNSNLPTVPWTANSMSIKNSGNLNLQAASGSTDSGDIVFMDGDGNEKYRLYTSPDNSYNSLLFRQNAGTEYNLWHSGNLTPGQVKTTTLDTLDYLGNKLGDGITLDVNQDLTLDFSKVVKQNIPNSLRVKIPYNVIKNLEMDNTLSPVDYAGYGRPVSTPLAVSNIATNVITITNIPRYDLLLSSVYDGTTGSNRWALVNLDSNTVPTDDQPDGGYSVQTAIRAITFTDVHTANVTVSSSAGFNVGHKVMLISINNSRFKINSGYVSGLGITEPWRTRQIEAGYLFKKQSTGKWNMIVGGTASDINVWTTKLMEADSLYGPWTLSSINGTNLLTSVGSNFKDLTAAIPQTNKITTKYGCPVPNSSYHVVMGWGADSGSWSFPVNFKIYFVIFSEDFSDMRTIVARTNYTVKRGSSGYLHYPSLGYYKGKWYLSAIDDYPPSTSSTWTDENRWDRHVFVSDSLDGVFEYHSTIQVGRRLNQGSFYSNHPVNGYVFGFGDALYAYVSGTSRYIYSGNKGDAVTGFFEYDDATNTWNEFPSNFIPIPYGGDAVWGSGYERMKDHSGGPGLIIQDSNKLFLLQDYTNGSDNYQTALIEIPL